MVLAINIRYVCTMQLWSTMMMIIDMITTHRWLWLWQYPHEGSPDRSVRLLFDLFWGKELLSGKWRDRWKLGHVWKALLRVFSWKLFLKRDQTSCSEQQSNIELENSKSSLRREPMMGRIRKMWANHFDWVYQPYNWVGIPPSKQTLRQLQSGQCCICWDQNFALCPNTTLLEWDCVHRNESCCILK